MQIRDLIPWNRGASAISRVESREHPFWALQQEMNRVFDSFWENLELPFGRSATPMPRADVVETDKTIEVTVELPGMEEKDIDVSLSGDALTIKGEKKAERRDNGSGYYISERSYGAFHRTIPLPSGIDAGSVDARFRNGVLTITLRKTPEARARTRRIEVKRT